MKGEAAFCSSSPVSHFCISAVSLYAVCYNHCFDKIYESFFYRRQRMSFAPYEEILHLLVLPRYFLGYKRIIRDVCCSRINAQSDISSGKCGSIKVAVHLTYYFRLRANASEPLIDRFDKCLPAWNDQILADKIPDPDFSAVILCERMLSAHDDCHLFLTDKEAVKE